MLKLLDNGRGLVDTDTEMACTHSPLRELPEIAHIPSMRPAHGGFPEPESANVYEMIQQRQRRKNDRIVATAGMRQATEIRHAATLARQDGFERGLAAGRKRARHDGSFWFGLGVLVALVALIVMINVSGRHL